MLSLSSHIVAKTAAARPLIRSFDWSRASVTKCDPGDLAQAENRRTRGQYCVRLDAPERAAPTGVPAMFQGDTGVGWP